MENIDTIDVDENGDFITVEFKGEVDFLSTVPLNQNQSQEIFTQDSLLISDSSSSSNKSPKTLRDSSKNSMIINILVGVIGVLVGIIVVFVLFNHMPEKGTKTNVDAQQNQVDEHMLSPNGDVSVNDESVTVTNASDSTQKGNENSTNNTSESDKSNSSDNTSSSDDSNNNSADGSSSGGVSGGPANYGGSTSTTPPSYGSTNYFQQEVDHFFTHFDTPEERNEVLNLAGYKYDAAQDLYYTSLNPWQRYLGFNDLNDQAAPMTNMWYLTMKIDFKYQGLIWRIQCYKGQYGILEGAEMGVYTKAANNPSAPFYKCTSNKQLFKMYFDYYHSLSDYNKANRLFVRAEQEHWWLTGFKFGVVNPRNNVVRATFYAYDETMADGIEAGLQNVKGENGAWNGFKPYQSGMTNTDFYIRNGNRFSVVWYRAGYLKYNASENPSAPNPTVNL